MRFSKLPVVGKCLALVILLCVGSSAVAQRSYAVIAYVSPGEQPLKAEQVDAAKLTRINYAFGNLEAGVLQEASAQDAANLAILVGLKKRNPGLEVLVSIGGWGGSKGFSDAVLTKESRKAFVASVLTYVRKHNLDGVDIDWEYPGMAGAGNPFRAEDAQHFTAFLKLLRGALDGLTKGKQPHLLLTIAAGATPSCLAHATLREWQPYLDTINLMSYDYREPTDNKVTGNHAPLFDDPADPTPMSADSSVRAFEAAGVPSRKLTLGVPFYGHVWANVSPANHGLFQPGSEPRNGYAPYSAIVSEFLPNGYTRYWDDAAKVPYLYSESAKQFVSYEDPQSLALKCAYVKKQDLGGIMFWELLNDPSGQLLNTIDTTFSKAPAQ